MLAINVQIAPCNDTKWAHQHGHSGIGRMRVGAIYLCHWLVAFERGAASPAFSWPLRRTTLLPSLSSRSQHFSKCKMLCTKETVKKEGLNIWVDDEAVSEGTGPKLE